MVDSGFNGLVEVGGTRVGITTPYVPVGAHSFDVTDATGFAVGDVIGVERIPNQQWIDDLQMAQWGWTPESYEIVHERRITEILGNTLIIDIPIVDVMETGHGGGDVFLADVSGRIDQVGVEDLRLESAHTSPDAEDHGWNAVLMDGVENSWVRRVTAVHFGFSAVNLRDAAFNTVEEVAQLDPISEITGGRRYSFNVDGDSTGNLFQRCYAREGRHNFVTGSRVPGPNVWLDCLAVQGNSDEGPHHRWSTGMLLDNIWSQTVYIQNRADLGTGHGWAGNTTMFWNLTALGNVVCDAPLGGMNYVVGGVGTQAESAVTPTEADGWWESHPGPVLPRSLYLAQLEDRLGAAAVASVTLPEQLTGDVWALLNGWAGDGDLSTATPVPPFDPGGIVSSNGDVACADSCGWCGGSGCGSLPGGSSNCCSGTILNAGLSCLTNPAPCVMP